MLQDVFLFTGSIKNNITLFDDSYSNDDINQEDLSVPLNLKM